MTYADSNFGVYDIDGPDDVDFYHRVQQQSVPTECRGCGNHVNLLPHYAYCNSCADKIERGIDICD